MNLGPTELAFVLLFLGLGLILPLYAAIKAFQNEDNGWGIGILIGMLVPLGFVLAIVYLAQRGSRDDY